jgi:membrane-associated phospholipid phosphatase
MYIRAVSLFFILFTPFSRLYAGVHYPGDVLGGFFTGLISLYMIEWFFKKYPKFPDPKSWKNPQKNFQSPVLAVIAITVSTVLLDTSTQTQRGTANQIVSSAASAAGLFTGIVLWKLKYENYDLEDIKWIRTLFLLSLAIVSFYIGMGRISEHFFKDNEVFRYFRYFLLNFTIIYLVPYFSLVIFGEKENPT